jgi:hypothetical protein
VPVDPQVKQAHEQTSGSSARTVDGRWQLTDNEPNSLASLAVSARPSSSHRHASLLQLVQKLTQLS